MAGYLDIQICQYTKVISITQLGFLELVIQNINKCTKHLQNKFSKWSPTVIQSVKQFGVEIFSEYADSKFSYFCVDYISEIQEE